MQQVIRNLPKAVMELPRPHRISISVLFFTICMLFIWNLNTPPVTIELDIPEIQPSNPVSNQHRLITRSYKVNPGDTLSGIFEKALISPQTLHLLISSKENERILRAILPGETIEFDVNNEGLLIALRYVKSPQVTEQFRIVEGQVIHNTSIRYPEYRTRFAFGTINSSLFLAGQEAGMTDALTMELAQIFGWDIDFALDIRQGDRFSMIYQEKYLDGKMIGYGPILAARFENNGRLLNAIRYTDPTGNSDFYSPDGKSMRKAFLRTPLDFSRISSHFSLNRKHPILNKIRNHRGTDYAAARGTPIKAAGDGKVVFAGTKGGYGSTLIIQHGQRYSTLYAHLNAFSRNVRKGNTVKQGQIVAYVGSSGLATGPHLHYEFRVNGVPVNPVTVKLPSAKPINKDYKEDFEKHAINMIGQLDTYEQAGFAPAD